MYNNQTTAVLLLVLPSFSLVLKCRQSVGHSVEWEGGGGGGEK
jgi:hypothetical protein